MFIDKCVSDAVATLIQDEGRRLLVWPKAYEV